MSRRHLALLLILAAPVALRAEDPVAPESLRGVDARALAYTYTVGHFAPEYTPPAPGTYELPVVDTLDDHPLLDADGRPVQLFELTRDRIAVVAFVYTACVETAGCPLSQAVLQRLDRALAADAPLRRQVVLVSLSFDPERDDPAHLASVRAATAPKSDWRFVTTSGEEALAPLLDDFGQPVARLRFPDGRWTGLYRHVLKVFLLDRAHRVRNVYSTGFLDAGLVLNDVRTLLMER
jgi:cytochrome oxidase Cu insertion factor (SCO1/SenC/PrrC family)